MKKKRNRNQPPEPKPNQAVLVVAHLSKRESRGADPIRFKSVDLPRGPVGVSLRCRAGSIVILMGFPVHRQVVE